MVSPINEGGFTTLSGTFTDPGLDDHTLVVNWDDGTGDQTISLSGGARSFSVNHTYVDDNPPGTSSDDYDVTVVSLTDSDGDAAGGIIGGDIFLTGHDPDFHAQGSGEPGAEDLLKVGLDFVTNGTYTDTITKFLWVESRIAPPSGHRTGELALSVDLGLTLGTHYDRANGAELASVDFSNYSAIAIASTFGGLLTEAELDALIARKDDIEEFVNSGGGVFASAECYPCGQNLAGSAAKLFAYLPINLSSINASLPFQVTPFGTSLGLDNDDLQSPTHNSFADSGGLNIVDNDVANEPTTLAGHVLIGAGGFTPSGLQVTVNNLDPTITAAFQEGSIPEGSINTNGNLVVQATDPAGTTNDPLTFDFDCNNDANFETPAIPTTSSADCFFDDNGSFTVPVRVKDDDLGEDTDSITAVVTNVAPTAFLPNEGPIDEGDSVTFTFENEQDPSNADTNAGFGYSIDCDGNAASLATTYATANASPSQLCTFDDNGLFTVVGRIFDKDEGSNDYDATVQVNNVAPTASLPNAGPIDEGDSVTFTFENEQDPSNADTNAGFGYSIDCDGNTASLATTYAAANASPSQLCTYGDNGTFTVVGRIFDKDEGSNHYSATVQVNNVTPTLTVGTAEQIEVDGGAAFTGTVGIEQTHIATAVDDGSDDLTFTWTFEVSTSTSTYYNDGVGDDPADSPGGTFAFTAADTAAVTFATAGVYTVTVTVTDDDGASTTQTFTKIVTEACDCTKSQGFWKQQFKDNGKSDFDDATLEGFLEIINFSSGIFGIATISDANGIMNPGKTQNGGFASGSLTQQSTKPTGKKPKKEKGSKAENDASSASDPGESTGNSGDKSVAKSRDKALAQTLAAWLNFAKGAVDFNELIDTNKDGTPDTAFSAVIAEVESILENENATKSELEHAKDLAEAVNKHDKNNPDCDTGSRSNTKSSSNGDESGSKSSDTGSQSSDTGS